MRQDFIVYYQSCDKCQINNEPTTLLAGRSLTLSDPDEAYQSLVIDFASPFNKSNEYTTVMVIKDRFTSYSHLVPLKGAATSEQSFRNFKELSLMFMASRSVSFWIRTPSLPLIFGPR